MSTPDIPTAQRCVSHPSRLARDLCPTCERPRCEVDVAAFGTGCAVCEGGRRLPRRVGAFEATVRAGIATWPVVLAGGWIATQYVYDHIFSLVVPGLVGFSAALVAKLVAGRRDHTGIRLVMMVGAIAGILGTALGFRLIQGGTQSVLHPWTVVGAPYLCAIAGAVLYPIIFADPRPRS